MLFQRKGDRQGNKKTDQSPRIDRKKVGGSLDDRRMIDEGSMKAIFRGIEPDYNGRAASTGEENLMTRAALHQFVTETLVVSSSGLFLAWYVWAKLAVWPWGACSF